MRTTPAPNRSRYDRTVRAVMWMDAFLSVTMAGVCLVATPVVAALGVPRSILFGLAMTSVVCAVLLAAFGAITAFALVQRMRAGQFFLPNQLRLPLPPGMNPDLSFDVDARDVSSLTA